jgi:DNA helicase-2/ATP-dependent DNA helicase PcrA
MESQATRKGILQGLNAEQQRAVRHGDGPLLIIAGAGTGKTRTLVHRVGCLIEQGTDPSRILLLTFTRRAAGEMLRRVDSLLRRVELANAKSRFLAAGKVWGGTFHAMAARLLRMCGKSIGLDPAFTIHDRSDSEDLLAVIRTELNLARTDKRFPKKGTCLAIYSRCVNSRQPLEKVLAESYPWCEEYTCDLKRLFQAYVDRKEHASVLDYDDLLLFWHGLLLDPKAGERVRRRFDSVLVDEYQDTNHLQGEILQLLRPGGAGLTVVGDDAQSIYSFRAATVRNIFDFPKQFPGTTVVKLEQNYRSTQAILTTTNQVIAQASERYPKELWSDQQTGEKPWLVTCQDENEQAEFIVQKVLEHREAGVELRNQAVLFRASHHSIVLEAELARSNIPFVKYGGLKFVETAHVKDLMGFLRLAENPRDIVAGMRVLELLPGIGPKKAHQLMNELIEEGGDFRAWAAAKVPAAASEHWPGLVKLMRQLTESTGRDVSSQVHLVRKYYAPLLEERYDNAEPRRRDLEQLEQVAGRFADRRTMLAELTLDPPASTQDLAGEPLLDEDYLVLSTIHSAKGLEWNSVFVIHAADGNIPSDMATGSAEPIEEERRLFYVALTRSKSWLYICFPQRYYFAYGGKGLRDRFGFAQLTRFITAEVREHLHCCGTVDGESNGAIQVARTAGQIRKRTMATF